METVKAKDLKLADVVRLSTSEYSDATVRQVKDGLVTFFRPYAHNEDFSYTGGVICYTGVEEFSVMADEREYIVLRRSEVR